MNNIYTDYYAGPERRIATKARRDKACRRHRMRIESLVSDCRTSPARRDNDDMLVEMLILSELESLSNTQAQMAK